MELVHIFLTSLGSIILLFVLTKIMGDRQISQLSMFDYVTSITIGSIAAEMATSLEDDFLKPLVAMVMYGLTSLLLSFLTTKSIKLRRFFTGKALILMDGGNIYRKNLKKAKIDLDEFLTLCRNAGHFDISSIETAILEANGKLSILPVSLQRPLTPKDISMAVAKEKPVANVILDGNIIEGNLRFTGHDPQWLSEQLQAQGVANISDVFLATCDHQNKLNVYVKIDEPMTRDLFE